MRTHHIHSHPQNVAFEAHLCYFHPEGLHLSQSLDTPPRVRMIPPAPVVFLTLVSVLQTSVTHSPTPSAKPLALVLFFGTLLVLQASVYFPNSGELLNDKNPCLPCFVADPYMEGCSSSFLE